jgi:ribosome-associated translation inhibitor RaiA
MKLAIHADQVTMRPEWHDTIEAWADRCRRHHPMVIGIDIRLRHRDDRDPGAEVEAVASMGRWRLRATIQATLLPEALHDVLEALEDELLVHEAVSHAA